MSLYHYTCYHGYLGLGYEGTLYAPIYLGAALPANAPAWQKPLLELIWLTDLDRPARNALGLTSHALGCDRTAHRYRVVEHQAKRWSTVRWSFPAKLRDGLEGSPGAKPMHWWVSSLAVPVVLDPVGAA